MSSTEKRAVVHRFYKWKNNTIQYKITDFYGIFRENTRMKPIISYRPKKVINLSTRSIITIIIPFIKKLR